MPARPHFSPAITALLEAIATSNNDIFSAHDLEIWKRKLSSSHDSQRIAEELIGLAIRFHQEHLTECRDQMIFLATTVVGDELSTQLLHAGGLNEAQKLVKKTQVVGSTTQAGLVPPTKSTTVGVGMRGSRKKLNRQTHE